MEEIPWRDELDGPRRADASDPCGSFSPAYYRITVEPLGMVIDVGRRVRMPQRQEHYSGGHQVEPLEQRLDLQARAPRQRSSGAPVKLGGRLEQLGLATVAGVRDDEIASRRHHVSVLSDNVRRARVIRDEVQD